MAATFEDLKKALKTDCFAGDDEDLVVMKEPGTGGSFSLPELYKVRRRPFAITWYISALSIDWHSVWLRTHFGDNAEKTSPTRRIRDLVKSTITPKVQGVVAKAILADVLTAWFEMDASDYYSVASMLASVLSKHGEGVTFETSEELVEVDPASATEEEEIGVKPEGWFGNKPTHKKTPSVTFSEQIPEQADTEQPSDGGELKVNKKTVHRRSTKKIFMLQSHKEQELARLRFTHLLNILFTKIAVEDFLVKNENANIYRLVYCLAKSSSRQKEYDLSIWEASAAAILSFFFQVTFTGYIIAANVEQGINVERYSMILLSFLTLFLSMLLAFPEIRNVAETKRFYFSHNGPFEGPHFFILAGMDFFTNLILPIVLTVSGFLIILIQTDFVDAVLNSTALLFILEIDDLLPAVLSLDPTSIVRNFLISSALLELNDILRGYVETESSIRKSQRRLYIPSDGRRDSEIAESDDSGGPAGFQNIDEQVKMEKKRLEELGVPSIDFADMMLTNSPETGTDIKASGTFAPYEIQGEAGYPDISNSNYISGNCLLCRIEWRYTYKFGLAREPRIGMLRVWKLEDKEDGYGPMYELMNFRQRVPESKVVIDVDPHLMTKDHHQEEMKALAEKHPDLGALKKDKKAKQSVLDDLDAMNPIYRLDGVYMITVFEVSETLLKLRVCGSKSANDFSEAMEAYSLWDLDASANSLLNKHMAKEAAVTAAAAPRSSTAPDASPAVAGEVAASGETV